MYDFFTHKTAERGLEDKTVGRTFFTHKTAERGCGRELYHTPRPVIISIVNDLLDYDPTLKNRIWIDPCAGDGVWGEVFDMFSIRHVDYDINPLNDKVIQQDFYNMNRLGEDFFIIGNPPFTEVKKFVNKALSICDKCYFLGGSMLLTGGLSDKVQMLHRFEGCEGNQKDKRSKITFITTLGERVFVWCCGAVFTAAEKAKFNRSEVFGFRVGAGKGAFCQEDDRVRVLRG